MSLEGVIKTRKPITLEDLRVAGRIDEYIGKVVWAFSEHCAYPTTLAEVRDRSGSYEGITTDKTDYELTALYPTKKDAERARSIDS